MTEMKKPAQIDDADLDSAGGGKIVFSDLIVSSYQTGGSSGADAKPIESLSLNYEKIQTRY